MTMLAENYADDALTVAFGKGGNGRWRMFQAADEVVLQIRFLEQDFGMLNLIFGKWNPVARAIRFALGRLLPPEEFLVMSVKQDRVELRGRIGSIEFQEKQTWVRRQQPLG